MSDEASTIIQGYLKRMQDEYENFNTVYNDLLTKLNLAQTEYTKQDGQFKKLLTDETNLVTIYSSSTRQNFDTEFEKVQSAAQAKILNISQVPEELDEFIKLANLDLEGVRNQLNEISQNVSAIKDEANAQIDSINRELPKVTEAGQKAIEDMNKVVNQVTASGQTLQQQINELDLRLSGIVNNQANISKDITAIQETNKAINASQEALLKLIDKTDDRIDQINQQIGDIVKIRTDIDTLKINKADKTFVDGQLAYNAKKLDSFLINVKFPPVPMVGAKGDGVTNDTLILRAIIENAPAGSTVYFPPSPAGYYVTNDLQKYILKIDKPIRILGSGIQSLILIDEYVPTDTDVFYISPQDGSDVNVRGYSIKGMTVVCKNGAEAARHAIHINVTRANQKVANSEFEGNMLYPTGGHSFCLTNPTNSDGFFTSQIEKNLFFSGVKLQRCGDSVNMWQNTITGKNGLDLSMVEGSNTFVFMGNNFTGRGGIILRSGHNIKILYNNLEVASSVYESPNGALLDVSGDEIPYAWGLQSVDIIGNNFTYQNEVAPDGVTAIRVDNASEVVIEGNYMTNKNSNQIVITNSAYETVIGKNTYSTPTNEPILVDKGVRTIRRDAMKLNYVGTREMYSYIADVLKESVRDKTNLHDILNLEDRTPGSIGVIRHVWNEGNKDPVKKVVQTVRRLSDGSIGSPKNVKLIGDGYEQYAEGTLVMTATNGTKWRLLVSNTGTLSTQQLV